MIQLAGHILTATVRTHTNRNVRQCQSCLLLYFKRYTCIKVAYGSTVRTSKRTHSMSIINTEHSMLFMELTADRCKNHACTRARTHRAVNVVTSLLISGRIKPPTAISHRASHSDPRAKTQIACNRHDALSRLWPSSS